MRSACRRHRGREHRAGVAGFHNLAGSWCEATATTSSPFAPASISGPPESPRQTVTCWGVNTSGELGNGTTTSTASVGGPIAGLTGVTQIATGVAHTCVLENDGTIRCWGAGGLIGDGTTTTRLTPRMPVQFSYAAEIVAGAGHTCARMTDNTVQCWGFNTYGQLGNGTSTSSLIPRVVPGLSNVAQLTAGENHTCALTPISAGSSPRTSTAR